MANPNNVISSFDYQSAAITATCVTETNDHVTYKNEIDGEKIIYLNQIDHYDGRLTYTTNGAYIALCILCAILAVAAYFVLKMVDISYLNIIVAAILGVLAVVFLLLFAFKRSAYFTLEIYTTVVGDSWMSVNYDSDSLCIGNKFPQKIEIVSAVKGGENASLGQSQFVSHLSTAFAEMRLAAKMRPYAYPYNIPGMPVYPAPNTYIPVSYIRINAEEGTINLEQ